MNVKLLYAVTQNNLIGNNKKPFGLIPPHIERAEKLTRGQAIVMEEFFFKGFSNNEKPFPDRTNIIIKNTKEFSSKECFVFCTLNCAMNMFNNRDSLWVVGGDKILRKSMDIATELHVTLIRENFLGNMQAPNIDSKVWDIVQMLPKENYNGLEYQFLTYKRK